MHYNAVLYKDQKEAVRILLFLLINVYPCLLIPPACLSPHNLCLFSVSALQHVCVCACVCVHPSRPTGAACPSQSKVLFRVPLSVPLSPWRGCLPSLSPSAVSAGTLNMELTLLLQFPLSLTFRLFGKNDHSVKLWAACE